MLLRDFLNEFELDWAQAAVRSGQISQRALKGAGVLIAGEQLELQEAIAWSFMAWNDEKHSGVRVAEAAVQPDGTLGVTHQFTEEAVSCTSADYVILSGLCCSAIPETPIAQMEYLQTFGALADAVCRLNCRRILLLSDGRVYGTLAPEFAASEYEAGQTDVRAEAFSAQYLLQAMESLLLAKARAAGKSCSILRTGLLYGACLPGQGHIAYTMAKYTAEEKEQPLVLSPVRASYVSIHDVLTAIQFVLTVCPENKIFNVKGKDSDQSPAELAILLYQNFPKQCHFGSDEHGDALTGKKTPEQIEGSGDMRPVGQAMEQEALLNTQLLEHYGFVPQISMEDGLIILVKYLQHTDEVFIFDNTYLGKLKTVQEILLGYLLEIDRICRKYHIRYFLAGGTLLGAIRHHGFIPWDDDADVMMLREDYDRFLKVVQEELPENIFVQLPTTEKGNHNPFTKLRINDTMFATEFTGHFMDMHNGIFFDVLAHDQTGNHKWSQKLHLMLTMLSRSIVFNKWGNTDIKSGGNHPVICKIVDHLKYLIPMPFAQWVQNKALTFFKNRNTDYLYDGMGRNLKRGAFPKRWLEETVYVDFEGYKFPVPKEYDQYLTWLYGDYMQMIPVSARRTSHSIVLTDLGAYGNYRIDGRE